jgi:hypothetical protein
MRENGMEFTEEEIASLANAIFQVLLHNLPNPMQYPILIEYSTVYAVFLGIYFVFNEFPVVFIYKHSGKLLGSRLTS